MPRQAPQATGRVLGVFELEIDRNLPPAWVRLVTSVPGRDGTFARTYELVAGQLTQSGYEDLTATLLRDVLQSFTARGGGVQGELRTT